MTERTAAPNAHTLLTALSLDQVQVLAIPFTTALAELRTYGALLHARTLGAARSDPTAANMVELQLPTYLEQQWQDADLEADVDEAELTLRRSATRSCEPMVSRTSTSPAPAPTCSPRSLRSSTPVQGGPDAH